MGSPDQGNIGGWNPRMHWNGVMPVAGLVREFERTLPTSGIDSTQFVVAGSRSEGNE